ncbi:MAG: extracellular solute-binding protein [Alphaproteobacteria bacterium]|nr:extracellular solute-binding protein [Alphaproteobacteria bacterium]
MTYRTHMIVGLSLLVGAVAACSNPTEPADSATVAEPQRTLTLYSARHYDSDKALYAMFEEQAGVNLDVRESRADQLIETMKAEGDQSPADVIITADAGSLWRFQDAGLTQAVASDDLSAVVPQNYRQSQGHWYGLARRLRGIAYDPARWSAEDLATWDKLAEEDKSGEICVRSSSNIYNLSLMSEIIHRYGADDAQAWATAIVGNMARNPQGGDTDQIRAIAAGECSIAIVNHYYWVRLGASEKEADRNVATSTTFLVPEFSEGSGSHVNITGAAISATADDVALAEEFIAFLLTDTGQSYLTRDTKELPLLDGSALPTGVENVPEFIASGTSLDVYGENQAEAQRLFDLAGWN